MPSATSAPLVEIRGFHRRYGNVPAIRGVDLDVDAGELILLLGPNGAGKSTLLRGIAGLARPSRGTVRVLGRDIHADPGARGGLGFLAHHSFLYDDLTARENLRFAAALHGLTGVAERVMDALNAAGLADRADRRVGGFSRGMVQRLAIARATLHQPTLLLLDEPFTGLDTAAAAMLRGQIAAECARGCAVLCVTHEPAESWDAATRVVVLVSGRIVLDAPRPAALDDFRRTYRDLVPA